MKDEIPSILPGSDCQELKQTHVKQFSKLFFAEDLPIPATRLGLAKPNPRAGDLSIPASGNNPMAEDKS